jgi:ribosomal protein L7/L12/outer membrane protein assembly factor BamB
MPDDAHAQTFNCPSCGAPLHPPQDGRASLECSFCHNTVIVPAVLQSADHNAEAQQEAALGEILGLLAQSNKIEAIKRYRETFDTGLKEAKHAVEALETGRAFKLSEIVAQARGPRTPVDDAAILAEVTQRVRSGKKIEAIKRMREVYVIGLKQAKDLVDAIESGQPVDFSGLAEAQTTPDQATALAEIARLAAGGQKIEAIKLFRQTFDVGLNEAKDAVEAIAAGQPFDLARRPTMQITSTTIQLQPGAVAKAAAGGGCLLTGFILFIVLVAVGVPLGAIFFTSRSPLNPLRPPPISYEPAILFYAGQDGPPDVVAMTYNSEDDTRALTRLNIANRQTVWTAAPLAKGQTSVDSLIADGQHIFGAAEVRLFALNAADGNLAWETIMPDRVGYCDEQCFKLHNGKLVLLGVDDALRAFDAQTGAALWELPLEIYSRWFEFYQDQVFIIVRDEQTYAYDLVFVDLNTGQVVRKLTPVCQIDQSTENLDTDNPYLYDEAEGVLYLIYGWHPGCVDKWSLVNGQQIWQTATQEGYFSASDIVMLPTSESIYAAIEGRIEVISKGSGEARRLAQIEDYKLAPLAVEGNRLLVRAERTRGTRRFELWGMDTASGERIWQIEFPEGAPFEEFSGLVSDDDVTWTWRLFTDQLALIKAEADPNQIVVETLNLQDGAQTNQIIVPIESSSDFYSAPTLLGWQGRTIWLIADTKFYAIDIDSGEKASWK